jgi:peptidoglycan/xylan/chitin deacetylase (PgdA/CDA1 family)
LTRVARLQILMYHAIGGRDEPPTRFVVPIDTFARQMDALAKLPVAVVSLEEACETLSRGGRLPRRSVALTFDDGTRDVRTRALPILRHQGFPATVFVVTAAMGATVDWTDHTDLAGRDVMTWAEALELQPLVRIQPHTRTHPSLPQLPDAALADELAGSRADVEQRVGGVATVFAYPYGHYDAHVAQAAAAAGYTAACTVTRGFNDRTTPAYELRRYEVRGDLSLKRFLLLLAGR